MWRWITFLAAGRPASTERPDEALLRDPARPPRGLRWSERLRDWWRPHWLRRSPRD